jgi:GNAT superfamily N-acetyltransferase
MYMRGSGAFVVFPVIRLSTPADRDAILSFIQRNGFNPRDAVTWDSLHMLAMTAWIGDTLVGAIPMEPRELCVRPNQTIRTLHETVVAVDPSHRGGGLGSQMQNAIADLRPGGAELLTVFREDPQSPAYRWYLKNGFSPVMSIDSWICDDPAKIASSDVLRIFDVNDPNIPWQKLRELRRTCPGMVDRTMRDLQNWLAVHPYRQRYRFHIIHDDSLGYGVLGVGTMHSETIRADVLEFASDSPEKMLRAIAAVAAKNGWRPLRFPLAKGDPNVDVVRSLGFAAGWPFDMLARPLGTNNTFSNRPGEAWRYAGIDYI